ncbi:hypothetical protein [Sporomusa aerivorans]|uniref:hypothetical protein n=1 Tax=Sporomusa aerivorans TaxID=204936 RepID=UPI00352A0CBA
MNQITVSLFLFQKEKEMKNLEQLLENWNQGMQREFNTDPKTLIDLGNQILLGSQIISALQAENTNLKNMMELVRKERLETMEPWLAQYGIPYDCGWRDSIDELIQGVAKEDDLAIQFFNALNDAGIKYRLSPDGSIDYLNETEKALGDAIAARIEAEANQGIQRCRVCGCTDNHACPGGCYWVEEGLCSACAGMD